MDIPATQRLPIDNDSGNHNLIMQLSTPQDRIHQVASLCIKNKKYPIFEGINTIGRNPTSDIVLTDSEILRPQRFYQVNDGVQLTFGTVNGRYLFLRDLDNSIIVPETPASNAKSRPSLSTVRPKKLNNSLINKNDEDSIIGSTSSLNNDDGVFAMPSPRSQQSSSRILNRSVHVQVDATELSIHNVSIQQYIQSRDVDESIHSCQTQQISELDVSNFDKDIHEMETQQYENEPNKLAKSIYDIETQKFDTTYETDMDDVTDTMRNPIKNSHEIERPNIFKIDEVGDNTSSAKLNLPQQVQQSIHDSETQKLDKVAIKNAMIDDNDDDPTIAETQEFNSNAKVEMLINKTNKDECKISGLNSHIIKETDDEESETDEDGEFSNLQINNKKDNASEKHMNQINEDNSETDEDGEFEELSHNCLTSLMNSNKKICDKNENKKNATVSLSRINKRNERESPCLNERFDCESPIPLIVDQLRAKQIRNMGDDSDSGQSLSPTQVVLTNCQEKVPIIEKYDAIINDDDTPTQGLNDSNTNHGTVESTKRSLYENYISDDDDISPTQIIEKPKQKTQIQQLPKLIAKNNDDDTDIDQDDDEITTQLNTPNIAIKNHSENDDDSTQIIDQIPKMNDSTKPFKCAGSSQNVSNERGETWDDNYFDDFTPTQITNVQAMKIQSEDKSRKTRAKNSESKNVTKNRKSTKSESDDDTKMSNSTIRKTSRTSRISLRLQRKINTSLPDVGEKSKTMENLNDSVSKNLANLFGEEGQEKKLDEPIPLATQQLQDILEPAEKNLNKNMKRLRSGNKLSSSNSSGIESQDVYFSKLHSKRKRNVIHSSQDSTESESGKNTLSLPTKIFEYNAEISGSKNNVAVCSKEAIGVREFPAKKRRGNSATGEENTNLYGNNIVLDDNNVESYAGGSIVPVRLETKVSNEELNQKQQDDILAGLPEVRIYGTASYPASPSSSVCSLDDWELFEKKREERLKVSTTKKPLTTIKSLSRICPDDKNKTKAITEENSSTVKLSDMSKMLVSSEDEDLGFEDLKKMAVGFIAADSRTKNLSIKLEKIPIAKEYQTSANYRIEQGPMSPVENSQVLPRRRARGRLTRMIDPELTLQNKPNLIDDDKSSVGTPSCKRPRLNKKSRDTISGSPNSSVETRGIRTILQKSTSVEVPKRTKKIPAKLRDKTDSPKREAASKQKKSKLNVASSPSGFSRSRMQHKVLFTGVFSSNYEEEVKQCGGTIVEKPEQATILVTDKIRRTNKFFCAISRQIPIVSLNWIEASFKEKHFLDWSQYILEDPVTEVKYNFKLQQSLERAKKKKLLDGYTFIITGKVTKPGPEEIKSMIQISGGKAVVRLPKLWLPNTIIISCTDDILKVRTILSKVPKQFKIPVYTTEFLLLGILKQELNFNANQVELRDSQ